MRHLMPFLAAAALVLSTGAAYADCEQLFKLLANDGRKGDNFGISVAISGTTAIVGAHGDDDNGGDSGSAYLFDTTTGEQIAKLRWTLPSPVRRAYRARRYCVVPAQPAPSKGESQDERRAR